MILHKVGRRKSRAAANSEPSLSVFARRELFRRVGEVLWRFRRRVAAALVLLVLAKLFAVLVPVALKRIVDVLGVQNEVLALPVFLLLGYALLRFVSGLFTELRDLVFARVTQTAVAEFTVRMFDHLHSLGVQHLGSRQTGVFSRDVQRGTAGVGFLLGTALFTVLPTLIEIVSVVAIMMSAYHLGFAGIVFTTFIVYGIFTVVYTERRVYYQRQLNDIDSAANGYLVDSLMNYSSVKLHAAQAAESARLRGMLGRWIDVGIDNQRTLSMLHTGQSGIIAFGVAAVMLLAGQEVVNGEMAVGDLILVNAYIIQICLPLNSLGLMFRQAREALINAERMSELLRLPPEAPEEGELPPLQLRGGAVEFDRVDFSYEPGREILHEVSFRIAPGATVAVVGGSGSGKSTLARLLLRMYDADGGSILIDGQDIRTISHASLRRAIGVVPQDSMLFNNTIAYNIGYGRPGATPADIIDAARAARIHDLIQSLPAQYETMVGERGVKLSGGERQRIAIARAVLKNPPLLIFDEATSALDSHTEKAIQEELDRLAQGRTTLIIAHRLSTVAKANEILVMDHGRIIERGSHSALLQQRGRYAQMWNLQRQESALNEMELRLSAQAINLVALLGNLIDVLRPMAQSRGIMFYTIMEPDDIRVTGDPSALLRILTDIGEHAIDVTPPGGRIELRLALIGDEASVRVTDDRLPPERAVEAEALEEEEAMPESSEISHAREKVIDPLHIQSEMERMGGRLVAHPVDGGPAMSYAIFLPVRAVAPQGGTAVMTLAEEDMDLTGLVIAVADDREEARTLVGDVLQDHGATVRCYDSGVALLDALRDPAIRWPDILVCDLGLGDPDGFQVMEEIRRMESQHGRTLAHHLPAIALSGYGERRDRLRSLLAGFQIHIAKPVDARELVASVAAVAPRRRVTAAPPSLPGGAGR